MSDTVRTSSVIRRKRFAAVAIIVGALALVTWCSPPSGTIEGVGFFVSRGDTLMFHMNSVLKSARLERIDAPEPGQPFGTLSRESLTALCFGKRVRVKYSRVNEHGSFVGRVWCNDVDANAEQVRLGLAWVANEQVSDRNLYELQDEAKSARRGLWSDSERPIPPWEWRRVAREKFEQWKAENRTSASKP